MACNGGTVLDLPPDGAVRRPGGSRQNAGRNEMSNENGAQRANSRSDASVGDATASGEATASAGAAGIGGARPADAPGVVGAVGASGGRDAGDVTSTPDAHEASGGGGARPVNRCQCCQQVLPEQKGRSRPRKYCADGTGRFEAEYGITCAELGPALEKVRQVFGAEAVPNADLDLLTEPVTTGQQLLGPGGAIAGLTDTLHGVRVRLDETVKAALARAEAAEAAERDALGRAEADARLRREAEER